MAICNKDWGELKNKTAVSRSISSFCWHVWTQAYLQKGETFCSIFWQIALFSSKPNCTDSLDHVLSNSRHKSGKIFLYTRLFFYTAVFSNSCCRLQYCSVLGSAHLVFLTCYNLILCLSHAGRTGYRDGSAGVTTILYSTARDPCRLLAAWLFPLSYPISQVIRKASRAQAECWNPYSYAGQAHGHVAKPMSLSVSDRRWSGLWQ